MEGALYYTDLAPFFHCRGIVSVKIDGDIVEFDASYPHERQYIAKLLLDVKVPQADIDTALFKEFVCEGDRVIDIGANIGFTAIECLNFGASSVVAVEPVPALFERLLKNTRGRSIFPLSVAISNFSGWSDMTISKLHNHGSTLKCDILRIFPQVFGGEHEIVRVAVSDLDSVIDQHGRFDLWKIDAEGAEIEVLQGAGKALSQSPPRVIIAEVYDDFLGDFLKVIARTHPYGSRAFIRKNDYGLELVNVRASGSDAYEKTSPMYVFAREKLFDLELVV